MKPYNVEIFDRDLNYKYSTVIDDSDFVYNEDFMDPEKNTIAVPSGFVPLELAPTDINAPKGWYIRIKNDLHEYQGIISGFETGEAQNYITYAQMITAVNLQMLVATAGVTQTTVEEYIKDLIEQYFILTDDQTQKIQGLTNVSVLSQTEGMFDFNNNDEDQTIIDFLDDLVYPAFELYGIVTNISFDAQLKKVNISVGKVSTAKKTIEADLPNVVDKSFTIRRSNKEVNKVSVIDIENDIEYKFFLHPDGTFDQNDTDRIDPVVNSIVSINGQTLATNYVDAKYKNYINIISGLSNYDGTLSNEDFASLQTAVSVMAPLYIAGHALPLPEIKNNMTGATINSSIGATTYTVSKPLITQINTSGTWNSNGTFTVNTSQGSGHVLIYAQVTTQANSGGAISPPYTFNYQKYFTSSMANTGFKDYKETAAYTAEVAQAYETIILDNAISQAIKVFAKNKYNNLIELTCINGDSMIKPEQMEIGQEVEILHEGVSYISMLSGKEVREGKTKLSFGTIRLKLTSWLKGRY